MPRPYVLLSVHSALFCGDKVNIDLLRALQSRDVTRVSLVTSYVLADNVRKYREENTQLIRAIRLLERYGITVDHVFTSASPYGEWLKTESSQANMQRIRDFQKALEIQTQFLDLGDYFSTIIQPLEEALADASTEEDWDAILAKHRATIEAERAIVTHFQEQEQTEPLVGSEIKALNGEKEHLLQHAREWLLRAGVISPADPLLLFEDKPEVINNVQYAPWATAGHNQPPITVCAVDRFRQGLPEFEAYESALNEVFDEKPEQSLRQIDKDAQILRIFYIQVSTFKKWSLQAQKAFLDQIQIGSHYRILWLNDTDEEALDIQTNPEGALSNQVENPDQYTENLEKAIQGQIREKTLGTYNYNPTATKRTLKEQWASWLGGLKHNVGGGPYLIHSTLLLGEENNRLEAVKALEEDYSTDPAITVVKMDPQADAGCTAANAHVRGVLLYQITRLREVLSSGEITKTELTAEFLQRLQRATDMVLTMAPHSKVTESYGYLIDGVTRQLLYSVRDTRDEEQLIRMLDGFYGEVWEELLENLEHLDHPQLTDHQLNELIEYASKLLCEKEENFDLVKVQVLEPLLETYQALRSESADNTRNPLSKAAKKRLEDRQALVRGTLLKTLNEFTKTLSREDAPSFNEACTNASKVLETAAKHKLSKRSGFKAFFTGLAGFLAALPTLLLAYKNKNFRSTFWHQEKEEGAFWGGTFRTCRESLKKVADPSTSRKKP